MKYAIKLLFMSGIFLQLELWYNKSMYLAWIAMDFDKKTVAICTIITCAICTTCVMFVLNNQNEPNIKIAAINYKKLKNLSECYKIKNELKEYHEQVMYQMRNAEKEAKNEYWKVRKNDTSAEEKERKIKEIDDRWKNKSDKLRKRIADIKSTLNSIYSYISKTREFAKKIATKKNVHLVLNDADVVSTSNSIIDITSDVADELNKKFGKYAEKANEILLQKKKFFDSNLPK